MAFRSFTDTDTAADLDLVSSPAPDGGLLNRGSSVEAFQSGFQSMLGQPDSSQSTQEVYLLEKAEIIGRKTELRQLLKLINMSRQGQPKAVLLAGDSGTGKTALLDSFTDLVRQAIYSRIVDFRQERFKTPQHFYVTLIDKLRQDAERMLNEALLAINEELSQIGLVWEIQDLIRAVSLVQLQETLDLPPGETKEPQPSLDMLDAGIGGSPIRNRAMTEEQLMKAIKNSVPTVKKLRLSLNGQVERLVKLILNPWVITACHLMTPVDGKLKMAFALSDDIKANDRVFDPSYTQDWEAKRPQYFQIDPDESETVIISKETGLTIINPRGQSKKKQAATQGPLADMISGLKYTLGFINRTIGSIESSLLLLFDNWESVAEMPHAQRDELKQLLHDVLAECSEHHQYRMMLLVAGDTASQSRSLGGPLFSQFRTKILLSTLEEHQARKLFKQHLHSVGVDIDESVHQQILQLTQGNPYWHRRAALYLMERAQANRIAKIDEDFYGRLCIEAPQDLLELAYTRVKLAFLQQEESLEKVIAALLTTFAHKPFQVSEAIREISLSQHLPESLVYDVLQRLSQHHFLSDVLRHPHNGHELHPRTFGERWLIIQNQIDNRFLQRKTASVQADLPTDEKLHFLKKVIPLSIQAGELDRAKTQEVLSLCHSLGNTDIVEYLETLFIDSLKSEQPAIRVTALNNLALIDSEKSRQALFVALQDTDAMVREYSARNLGMISHRSTDPEFHRQLVDAFQDSLDDEYEAVRAQVYQTLVRYRFSHDLMTVFIKGLSDVDPTVRLCSVKFLADTEQESPFIQNSLLNAMNDAEPEVRRFACLGIQRYKGLDSIQALVKRLKEDTEPSIRALAADSLGFMEDEFAFLALAEALMNPSESEDVKLAVVRTLGKRRSRQSEQVLLNALQHSLEGEEMPPALLWASIRSLGSIAASEKALVTLATFQKLSENSIIQNAAQMALKKIHQRMESLREDETFASTAERPLEPIIPTATLPKEFEQDVEVHEDDAND